jgi:hypothetical protein
VRAKRPTSGCGEAPAAPGAEGAPEGPLTLIHRTKVPTPYESRGCDRFLYVDSQALELALAHLFAAFDGLTVAMREADARST